MPTKSRKACWPKWSPSDLKAAHEKLSELNHTEWVAPTAWEIFSKKLKPYALLQGFGDQRSSLLMIKTLATDLRLKSRWETLARLESEKRKGNGEVTFFFSGPARESAFESISCRIAQICVWSTMKQNKVLTLRKWRQRHSAIATLASQLAELVRYDGCVDSAIENLASVFTAKTLRPIVEEINGPFTLSLVRHYPGESPEEAARRTATLETMTDAEIEALCEKEEAEDKRETNRETVQLHRAIESKAPTLDQLLKRLAEIATIALNNPPPAGPSNRRTRIASNLALNLCDFFLMVFQQPLDEVAAAFAEVATGTPITADAVKMRRNRLKKYMTVAE